MSAQDPTFLTSRSHLDHISISLYISFYLSKSTPYRFSIQMSETGSLSALCEFKKSDVGATLMGRSIRFDEASGLLSVKDVIEVIEDISPEAAKQKLYRFIKDNVISEGTDTGFEKFKSGGKYKYVFINFSQP
jgi:hypothetical protein